MKNNLEDLVKIIDIEILSSSFDATLVKIEIKFFAFNIDTEIQFNAENKCIEAIINTEIYSEDGKTLFGSLKTEITFDVEDYLMTVPKDKKQQPIDNTFFEMLSKIALSTTRGVMWHHFKGTFLHNAILPNSFSNNA